MEKSSGTSERETDAEPNKDSVNAMFLLLIATTQSVPVSCSERRLAAHMLWRACVEHGYARHARGCISRVEALELKQTEDVAKSCLHPPDELSPGGSA